MIIRWKGVCQRHFYVMWNREKQFTEFRGRIWDNITQITVLTSQCNHLYNRTLKFSQQQSYLFYQPVWKNIPNNLFQIYQQKQLCHAIDSYLEMWPFKESLIVNKSACNKMMFCEVLSISHTKYHFVAGTFTIRYPLNGHISK